MIEYICTTKLLAWVLQNNILHSPLRHLQWLALNLNWKHIFELPNEHYLYRFDTIFNDWVSNLCELIFFYCCVSYFSSLIPFFFFHMANYGSQTQIWTLFETWDMLDLRKFRFGSKKKTLEMIKLIRWIFFFWKMIKRFHLYPMVTRTYNINVR